MILTKTFCRTVTASDPNSLWPVCAFLPRLGFQVSANPVVLLLLIALTLCGISSDAKAVLFQNAYKWQPDEATGYHLVRVCVVDESDAEQDNDDSSALNAENPQVSDIIGRIRDALRGSWEKHSSIRFIGWESCSDPNIDTSKYNGLYIHPNADNRSTFGPGPGTGSDGACLKDENGNEFECALGKTTLIRSNGRDVSTSLKPWGSGGDQTQCISYDWGTAQNEYRFSCIEQFSIHEFGHTLGFRHEWARDDPPDGCKQEGSLVLPNPGYIATNSEYDLNSMMAYKDECASVNQDAGEERFGSTNLSPDDIIGVQTAYPPLIPDDPFYPQAPGRYDVGVIPDMAGSCPDATEAVIFLDNEDDDNGNSVAGWTGAIVIDDSARLVFCRVDGTKFKNLEGTGVSLGESTQYAVLKMGLDCPSGSTEFVRYHDDEDDRNKSWMAGEIPYPSARDNNGTRLHWCFFDGNGLNGTMGGFPSNLGFDYGVVAPPNFAAAVRIGTFRLDDEDDSNINGITTPGGAGLPGPVFQDIQSLMATDSDTVFHLAQVVPPVTINDALQIKKLDNGVAADDNAPIGTVTSNILGINCGAICSADAPPGSMVILSQQAGAGYYFRGWTGACRGFGPTEDCMLETVAGVLIAVAEFAPLPLLVVGKTGAGSGRVTSDPVGIDCGTSCFEQFSVTAGDPPLPVPGAQVTLSAEPEAGSEFVRWRTALAGKDDVIPCGAVADCDMVLFSSTVQMNAEFRLLPVDVIIDKTEDNIGIFPGSGAITGLLNARPTDLDCGATCQKTVLPGSTILLKALPQPRAEFVGWGATGAVCGSDPSCEFIVSPGFDQTVEATFRKQPTLRLEVGSGRGSVTVAGSAPPATNCNSLGNSQRYYCALYSTGDVVGLVATPGERSTFDQWTGDPGCGDPVTMNGSKTCNAHFSYTEFLLTVSPSGTGAGAVNSDIAGINCGVDCSEVYPASPTTVVKLTAVADIGSVFYYWAGSNDCRDQGTDDDDGDITTALVTMTADIDCVPVFVSAGDEFVLNVSKRGDGIGDGSFSVSSDQPPTGPPPGFDCGLPACSQTYQASTNVTLSATPDRGSVFEGWFDGDPACDSGNGFDGNLQMLSNHICKPTFTAKLLLIDDSNQVGDSLNIFQNALNSTYYGGDFDVWDTTNNNNNPGGRPFNELVLDDIDNYARVIWFSGNSTVSDDFDADEAGPDPAAEALLGQFLDGGGCLLMTSQHYYRDRGLSAFMSDYLGASSISNEVSQTQVTGNNSAFSGLGPYSLDYSQVENVSPAPNFSDSIVPNATAQTVFSGDQGSAAIAKDNGTYRSVFFGFPFEAIPAGSDRRKDTLEAFFDYCGQADLDDQYEDNDEIGSAPGFSGQIAIDDLEILAGDVDYFRWTAEIDGEVTFRLFFTHAAGDLRLDLYNSGGLLIASSQTTTDNESITVGSVTAGDFFYLKVSGIGAAANDYRLDVVLDDVLENGGGLGSGVSLGAIVTGNDDFDNATPVNGTVLIENLKIVPGDDDYFAWTASQSGKARFAIQFTYDAGPLDIEVYSPTRELIDGVSIAPDEGGELGSNEAQIIVFGITAGTTLYVRVFGLPRVDNPYTLEIVETAVSNPPKSDDVFSDGFENTQ